MPASVADILRWEPQDARGLARNALARATVADEIAGSLPRLPAFDVWHGDGADGAQAAVHRLSADLTTHSEEATAVSRAASTAADEMEEVQRELRRLRFDAEDVGMEIEPASSRVVPGPGFLGTPAQLAANLAELEPRLVAIMAQAEMVESSFAAAIAGAGSALVSQENADQRGVQLVDFHGEPLPEKPSWVSPDPPPGGWSDDPITRAAQKIAYGHAGTDHLVNEWPPGTTREQMASQIEGIMRAGADPKGGMITGRTADGAPAIYDPTTNTIVIRDPSAPDAGTAFKPSAGEDYLTRKMPTRLPSIPQGELADVPKPPPVEPPKIERLPRGGGMPPMVGVPPVVGLPGSEGGGEVPILDSDGTPDVGMPGPGR